jgi:hypothetical protein
LDDISAELVLPLGSLSVMVWDNRPAHSLAEINIAILRKPRKSKMPSKKRSRQVKFGTCRVPNPGAKDAGISVWGFHPGIWIRFDGSSRNCCDTVATFLFARLHDRQKLFQLWGQCPHNFRI